MLKLSGPRVVGIIEKSKRSSSPYAVIGIYFYDGKVFDIVKTLKPSARNELEITDVNNAYIEAGEMTADKVQGFWADAGENIDFYLQACNAIASQTLSTSTSATPCFLSTSAARSAPSTSKRA